MVKKIGAKVCIVALAFLVSVFLISFASAAINVSIGSINAVDSGTTSATGSGTNYSNASTLTSQNPMVTLNVTFLNATDVSFNVTAGGYLTPLGLNASFYLVTEGVKTWTYITDSLNCSVVSTRIASCWTNISTTAGTFNISKGRYNITAVVYTANNLTGRNATINVTMVIFDHTPPINVNITGVPNGQNHSTRSNSGNLTLNVSIADQSQGLNASTSIDTVIFNIINITGNTNRTLFAFREGTGQYWSTSVNTSEFINGKYNITVAVNDSAGNFNLTQNSTTTAPIFSLIFDNSVPGASASCTPSSVNSGGTVTCSCTGSATSGVNSTSITANPSTSDTGEFTQTCSVTSLSGLTNTNSAIYTVTLSGTSGGSSSSSSSGSSSSSSTTTTYTTTIPYTSQELSVAGPVTREMGAKTKIDVKVEGATHSVGVASVSGTTATIEVSSTPQKVTMNVGETKKFEMTGDNYYDMSVTLKSIKANKAEVTISAVHEVMSAQDIAEKQKQENKGAAPGAGKASSTGLSGKIIAIIIVLVIIIAAIVWYIMRKK